MIARLLTITALLAFIAQIPSCHYYISAVPRIIISSEPFVVQPPVPEPKPPAFELGAD